MPKPSLQTPVSIAVDAHGGDFGLTTTVPACLAALRSHHALTLYLYGDEVAITAVLGEVEPSVRVRLIVVHTTQVVAMDQDPRHALKHTKDSSMRRAIEAVQSGQCQAVVSAGNTGALMAIAKFVLKTIEGVKRPAILSSFPTHRETEVAILDLGANVDLVPEHLYQFALMGSAAMQTDRNPNPRVALLNIGSESIKGNRLVKDTAALLAGNSHLNYIGSIEGDAVFSGAADVVVCDGFVGNVMLKSVKGAVNFVFKRLKETLSYNWYSQLVGLMLRPLLRPMLMQYRPSERNGAVLLGLNAIVVKSHGDVDAEAFERAIWVAIDQVNHKTTQSIQSAIRASLTPAKEMS